MMKKQLTVTCIVLSSMEVYPMGTAVWETISFTSYTSMRTNAEPNKPSLARNKIVFEKHGLLHVYKIMYIYYYIGGQKP